MTCQGILARVFVGLCVALTAAPESHSQDAFETFKQLNGSTKMPKLKAFSAPGAEALAAANPSRSVKLEAKLTAKGDAMQHGLSWRVFSPIPGADGKLPLLASAEGGSAAFQLAPGDYFVNVSFGRAGATKKLNVPAEGEVDEQVMVLDAGGLTLNAISGTDSHIPDKQLSFDIYSSEVREDGERGLVVADVKPNTIVRLNAGTYHVVSEYGAVNAVVRADIAVEAGELTEATIQHRASQIGFKLVSEPGGEAIADTAWSILTSGGDIVAESVSAFPVMVLSEGQYTVVARNKDKIYQKDFEVAAGSNMDVELALTP
ncbi:hypothetical protein [Rhizobium wuzhouense]|uniref:DUF4198 domain-containing protein n=1 Tax=Rhizobium wuzhouense TaxID=1986026 RepID=A0ABX5NMZ8_9HYPH|nr:hypothetical protein [Rhizobium wuzhouense]PYB71199.1 hypothetical protein DMY87_17675 [Rhizobium wuzhouense]